MKRKSQKLYTSALVLLFGISLQAHAENTEGPCVSGVGEASWYNVRSSSGITSFGKRFDDRDPEHIAYPGCPENTKIYITDLETGKVIPAEVKDNGPFTEVKKGPYRGKERVADLSQGAALKLNRDLLIEGTLIVLVQVVKD